jgi:MHS family alpha-ketoglutarate permease-like MFS transporter
VTLIGGQLTALAVLIVLQHALPKADLEAWGWRIPFAIGGLLAVVVFWIRTGLAETGSFTAVDAGGVKRGGALTLFTRYPRETWAILGLTSAGSLAFYAYTTYMQKFLVNTSGFSKDTATAITAAALVIYMLIHPLMGWMSDHVGRKAVLAAAMGLGAVATYPAMTAIAAAHSPYVAFGWLLLLLLILSGYTAVNAVVKAELFPAHIRALGVSLPYALGNTLFGGTAEYAALWFKNAGRESGFFVYISVVMAIGLVIALRLRDTNTQGLIQED